MLNNGLVVLAGGDVCLDGEDLDAVLGLKGFLGGLEFGDVAAGDYQVGALFGESDVDAVADRTSRPILEGRLAAAGDDNGF